MTLHFIDFIFRSPPDSQLPVGYGETVRSIMETALLLDAFEIDICLT